MYVSSANNLPLGFHIVLPIYIKVTNMTRLFPPARHCLACRQKMQMLRTLSPRLRRRQTCEGAGFVDSKVHEPKREGYVCL